MTKISIIIPAYNEQDNIVRCLESCLRQTVAADEILVIDNKSKDATREIVKKFIKEKKASNIKLLQQTKLQGLRPTRDFGFDAAIGDVYGRIDADSTISPVWVEVLRNSYEADPSKGGWTGPCTYYDMPFVKLGLYLDNLSREMNQKIMKDYKFLFGSNMAISAKAWAVIRDKVCLDIDDLQHEDIDTALHLMENGFDIAYVHQMIAAISARRMDDKVGSFREYTRRFSNTYKAHNISELSLKSPEVFLMSIYYPLHILRKFYKADIDKQLQLLQKTINYNRAEPAGKVRKI